MNTLTFLIKPASSLCNMRCRYCFYEDIADNRTQKSMGIMAEDCAVDSGYCGVVVHSIFPLYDKTSSISWLLDGVGISMGG